MLVKCETKSNRVKGLSFHPKLCWILATLHNGVIQLWDYRIGTLIERFEEHEGPVRGVDFHSSQPIFVSGGDDYKIKLWNYRQRRCLFTLFGHLDYIRTVQFHREYPWILSASDDQTVRIWNWQSRSCLAVLAGHNHYVMSAQFHPTNDMVISASLDQTMRVWDVSGLRDKTHSGMFGTHDAVCKFLIEGHDRGVNWATFHATMPLIASGADDRLVKLWRYSDSTWWEVDTFRSHFNNVSCVLFHPTKDLLLSNSEDRTIRIWDINKRTLVHTYRRENERFWVMTALRGSNVIAVGHDTGMVVLKLDRERPPTQVVNDDIYLIKDRWIATYDVAGDVYQSLVSCRRAAHAMSPGPRSLLYNTFNTAEVNLLVHYKDEPGVYDLLCFPSTREAVANPQSIRTSQGTANGVAFVARNRFAALDVSGSITIYNLDRTVVKVISSAAPSVEKIWSAGTTNRLLLKSDENVILYDVAAQRSVAELPCGAGVRYVVWSDDMQYLAILSKHSIQLATAKLEFLCAIHENIRVKGGIWEASGAFIYCSLSHLKYVLLNGDKGIIKCLSQPIYPLKMKGEELIYCDRQSSNVQRMAVNTSEYLFKLALNEGRLDKVALLIKSERLCGNAVVSYVRKKGFPEVALEFVADLKTRFNLALEYGNLEVAFEAASELKDPVAFDRIAEEAMRQGNVHVAEMSYLLNNDCEKLSFLYFLTGNTSKLKAVQQLSDQQGDVHASFQTALWRGNVEDRVALLAKGGQIPLAVVTAKVHGLTKHVEVLRENLPEGVDVEKMLAELEHSPKLFLPPPSLNKSSTQKSEESKVGASHPLNWPTTGPVVVDRFAYEMSKTATLPKEAAELQVTKAIARDLPTTKVAVSAKGTIEEDILLAQSDEGLNKFSFEEDGAGGQGGAWDEFDLALDDVPEVVEPKETDGDAKADALVSVGEKPQNLWLKHPHVSAADFICAGKFAEALSYLEKHIGLKNAEPLEPLFRRVYQSSKVQLPVFPFSPPMQLPLISSGTFVKKDHKPAYLITFPYLLAEVSSAAKLVNAAKFEEAEAATRKILQAFAVAVAQTPEEEKKLHELMDLCRRYVTALAIENERARLPPGSEAKNVELSSFFTCFALPPAHQLRILSRAMALAYKAKNFITAASLARRLLQGDFKRVANYTSLAQKARSLLAACENHGSDQYAIDYDPADSEIIICTRSFRKIPATAQCLKCAFCRAPADLKFQAEVCRICNVSELGARVLGISFKSMGDF